MAGPVGHHAVGTVGGVVVPAVADDGIGGHVAHLQAAQAADGVAVRRKLVQAGEPVRDFGRVEQEHIPLQGDNVDSLVQEVGGKADEVGDGLDDAVGSEWCAAVRSSQVEDGAGLHGFKEELRAEALQGGIREGFVDVAGIQALDVLRLDDTGIGEELPRLRTLAVMGDEAAHGVAHDHHVVPVAVAVAGVQRLAGLGKRLAVVVRSHHPGITGGVVEIPELEIVADIRIREQAVHQIAEGLCAGKQAVSQDNGYLVGVVLLHAGEPHGIAQLLRAQQAQDAVVRHGGEVPVHLNGGGEIRGKVVIVPADAEELRAQARHQVQARLGVLGLVRELQHGGDSAHGSLGVDVEHALLLQQVRLVRGDDAHHGYTEPLEGVVLLQLIEVHVFRGHDIIVDDIEGDGGGQAVLQHIQVILEHGDGALLR